MPKSSGKLNKTPEMLILRGQDYVACLPARTQRLDLKFFIFLKWMPAQEVLVWTGSERPAKPQSLFGTELTVNMISYSRPGTVTYHTLNLELAGVLRQVTTVIVDCSLASADPKWNSGVTANGFVESAAGSSAAVRG